MSFVLQYQVTSYLKNGVYFALLTSPLNDSLDRRCYCRLKSERENCTQAAAKGSGQ
jgi:hypothetical protein